MAFSSYNSSVTGFTGAQFVLPVKPAVFSWTVTCQSGVSFLNGFALAPGSQIRGGGYDTATLAGDNVIVVGCTGGSVVVNWDTANY